MSLMQFHGYMTATIFSVFYCNSNYECLLGCPLLLHMSVFSSHFYFLDSGEDYLVKELISEVYHHRSFTFVDTTKLTYKTYLDSYLRFCLVINVPAVPASSFSICLYATFLARSLKASSVRKYISITGLLHKEFGLANPLIDNQFTTSLLRGIKLVKGGSGHGSFLITIDILVRIRKLLNFRSSFHSSF